jgi:dihydrolipoamide dehydrogenase
MADRTYDLLIIGAGPGGYVCAIRAAQLGMRVGVVEKRPTLGGTCLNIGCIPSKALLQSSEKYHEAQDGLSRHGVKLGKVELDLAAMLARKDAVVAQLTKGVGFLFRKHKIEHIQGHGRLAGEGIVEVQNERISASLIVIATGSDSMALPGVDIDERSIVSSTGALALERVPATMAVIGAGYIGLEMGSVWSRLGAKVTVLEYLDRIAPGMDGEIARQFRRLLEKQGLSFRLGTKVTGAKSARNGSTLAFEPAKGGATEMLEAEVVLVAIGRRPFTDGLGLEEVGVRRDNRGFIEVNERFETSVAGVHAIGDVIRGPMLAHKAEEEGIALAELLAGQAGHVNYETVPGVIYTWPEVATVGRSEEQLKESGIEFRSGKFPFSANSRAICNDEKEGLVKILADAKTDRILGAHIIGPEAGNMIHAIINIMEFDGAAEDLARCFHAHPTYNEAVKEAALAVAGRAIHI